MIVFAWLDTQQSGTRVLVFLVVSLNYYAHRGDSGDMLRSEILKACFGDFGKRSKACRLIGFLVLWSEFLSEAITDATPQW